MSNWIHKKGVIRLKNSYIYSKVKKEQIEKIILDLQSNIINIDKLDNNEKDLLICYYNEEILKKKKYIEKLKEDILNKRRDI